jgi:hypothetical protein
LIIRNSYFFLLTWYFPESAAAADFCGANWPVEFKTLRIGRSKILAADARERLRQSKSFHRE